MDDSDDDLHVNLPRQLDDLKENIDWLSTIDLNRLTHRELVKVERRVFDLNDILVAIFERLDLDANL